MQPRNFNYAENACSVIINDNWVTILENLFVKESNPQKFCISKISKYTVDTCIYVTICVGKPAYSS